MIRYEDTDDRRSGPPVRFRAFCFLHGSDGPDLDGPVLWGQRITNKTTVQERFEN